MCPFFLKKISKLSGCGWYREGQVRSLLRLRIHARFKSSNITAGAGEGSTTGIESSSRSVCYTSPSPASFPISPSSSDSVSRYPPKLLNHIERMLYRSLQSLGHWKASSEIRQCVASALVHDFLLLPIPIQSTQQQQWQRQLPHEQAAVLYRDTRQLHEEGIKLSKALQHCHNQDFLQFQYNSSSNSYSKSDSDSDSGSGSISHNGYNKKNIPMPPLECQNVEHLLCNAATASASATVPSSFTSWNTGTEVLNITKSWPIPATVAAPIPMQVTLAPEVTTDMNQVSTIAVQLLTAYEKYLDNSLSIYRNITAHHRRLRLVQGQEQGQEQGQGQGQGHGRYHGEYSDGSDMVDIHTGTGTGTGTGTYAAAAIQMGSRQWVYESNKWMSDYAIKFFRKNGAKRDYIQYQQYVYNLIHDGEEMPYANRKILEDSLRSDLQVTNTNTNTGTDTIVKPIRVLDVGSCYNPLLKIEKQQQQQQPQQQQQRRRSAFSAETPSTSTSTISNSAHIDSNITQDKDKDKDIFANLKITAIDLYPCCPLNTVIQCDFLKLVVNDSNSIPVTATISSMPVPITSLHTHTLGDNKYAKTDTFGGGDGSPSPCDSDNGSFSASSCGSVIGVSYSGHGSNSKQQQQPPPLQQHQQQQWIKLLEQPSQSFDVVTMSLVLSYLPCAEQRVDMIKKARKLLISPTSTAIASQDPHKSGLLLIVEKGSIFSPPYNSAPVPTPEHDPMDLKISQLQPSVQAWVNAISQCGFRLVKYLRLRCSHSGTASDGDSRKNKSIHTSHAFAFRTVNDDDVDKMHIHSRDNDDNGNGNHNSNRNGNRNGESGNESNMLIRQDFEPLSVTAALLNGQEREQEHGKMPPWTADKVQSNESKNNSLSQSTSQHSPVPVPIVKWNQQLPIGIVGGGIGGCALALALQQCNPQIPVLLFEKDLMFSSRKQGYALTLQQAVKALEGLGISLHETLLKKGIGMASLSHCSYDKNGNVIGKYGVGTSAVTDTTDAVTDISKGKRRHNVHIPRQKLRLLMLDKLLPNTVRWSKSLTDYDIVTLPSPQDNDNNRDKTKAILLSFSDGSQIICSALVGADGIFSTVRLLLNEKTKKNKNIDDDDDDNDRDMNMNRQQQQLRMKTHHDLNYLGIMVVLGISPNHPTPIHSSHLLASDSATTTTNENRNLCEDIDIDISTHTEEVMSMQQQWLDGTTRVFSMPFGDGKHTMWQLSWPLSEEKAFQLMNSANPNISSPTHTETCGAHTAENKQKYDQHTHGSGSVLLAEALRLCAGWHEPLVNMLKRTHPNNITGHPTYDRDPHQPCEASPPHPTRCLSTHNSTNTCMNSNSNSSDDVHVDADVGLVTLLGDASHPMSPFKGQGANQAILDAVSLAKCLEMLSSFTPTNTDADTNYPRIAIGHDQEYGGQGHEGEYVMRLRNRHRHRQRQRHAQKHQHHHFPSVPTTTITTTPTTNITAAETTKAIATTFRKFESEMYIRSTPKVLKSRSAALYLHSPYALAKGNYTRAYAAENLNLK